MKNYKKYSKVILWAILLGLMLGVSNTGWTQLFRNQFIEFKLPDNWECRVEGTEWVCQSDNPKVRKESIIVFAAKVVGDQDNLKAFQDYLKKPREIKDLKNKPMTSKVTYTRKKNIRGHTWIDAIHKNAEIPGFLTRYLATTYQGIAILMTYSVIEPRYSAYSNLFSRMIESLRPLRDTKPLVAKGKEPGVTSLSVADLISRERAKPDAPSRPPEVITETKAPEEKGSPLWFLLILLLGLGGYFFYRMRKAKSKAPPEAPEGDEDEFEVEDIDEFDEDSDEDKD